MPSIRVIHRALPALAAVVLAATIADAQDTAAIGDHVRLRLVPPPEDVYARTRREGTLVRVGADSVALRERGRVRAFALHDVQRAHVRVEARSARAGAARYGIAGALAGVATGALAAAMIGGPSDCLTTVGGACYDNDLLPASGTAAATGALGGLLGAWYGATAGRRAWRRVALGQPR